MYPQGRESCEKKLRKNLLIIKLNGVAEGGSSAHEMPRYGGVAAPPETSKLGTHTQKKLKIPPHFLKTFSVLLFFPAFLSCGQDLYPNIHTDS